MTKKKVDRKYLPKQFKVVTKSYEYPHYLLAICNRPHGIKFVHV